jgi:hypothetical protein
MMLGRDRKIKGIRSGLVKIARVAILRKNPNTIL